MAGPVDDQRVLNCELPLEWFGIFSRGPAQAFAWSGRLDIALGDSDKRSAPRRFDVAPCSGHPAWVRCSSRELASFTRLTMVPVSGLALFSPQLGPCNWRRSCIRIGFCRR